MAQTINHITLYDVPLSFIDALQINYFFALLEALEPPGTFGRVEALRVPGGASTLGWLATSKVRAVPHLGHGDPLVRVISLGAQLLWGHSQDCAPAMLRLLELRCRGKKVPTIASPKALVPIVEVGTVM